MARLVPAIPKFRDAAEAALGLTLESSLDDDFVLFQGRDSLCPALLHPDYGVFALLIVPDDWRYEADTEFWLRPDGSQVDWMAWTETMIGPLADAINTDLPVFGVIVAVSDRPIPGCVAAPRVLLATKIAGEVMRRGKAIGDTEISAVIEILSPGAQPYSRGGVTQAQMGWRATRAPQEAAETDIVKAPVSAAPKTIRDIQTLNPRSRQNIATPDKTIIRMLESCVENALGGRPLFVAGVELRPADIASPAFLLPALLIDAAEAWSPVVASRNNRGGFHIRLSPDPRALLGYRVSEIHPSAPLLLFLPIVSLIQQSIIGNECSLDGAVESFARWLRKYELDAEIIDDVDIRLATSF